MRIRTVREIAAAVRGRRKERGMSQEKLAERAGVSRKWVYEFEAGNPAAEFGLILRVLDQLGWDLALSDARKTDRSKSGIDLDAVLEEHRRG